jgi:hypothetical protein
MMISLHAASALTDAGREHAFVGYSEKGTPMQASGALCTDDSSFCGDWAQQGECTKCARRPPLASLPPAPGSAHKASALMPHTAPGSAYRLSPPRRVRSFSYH